MRRMRLFASRLPRRPWFRSAAAGTLILGLAIDPTPLLPTARGYRTLCERYPARDLLMFHAPPLPVALLVLLATIALIAGAWTGVSELIRTQHFNEHVRSNATPLPPRLARAGARLGLADRMTYLGWAEASAFCYGFLRPRVAVSAGLVARLDDEELAAVLAHERQHLHRRDPVRYLLLHTLVAAAFMFPLAPALKLRYEARIELAADRAALAVASPGALAGALLAVLQSSVVTAPGAAGLSATEARIAQLSGRPLMPEIPPRLIAVSLGLVVVIMVTMIDLAGSADLVPMICRVCRNRF